jgi:hypothetical protein
MAGSEPSKICIIIIFYIYHPLVSAVSLNNIYYVDSKFACYSVSL